MRKLQLWLVCFSALLLASQAVNICMLYDPAVVDSVNADPTASEPQIMRAAATAAGHNVTIINASTTLASWDVLDNCAVLILPEFEIGLFLPIATTPDRAAILDKIRAFTARGGLTVSGGSPVNIDMIDTLFGLNYTHGDELFSNDTPLNRTAAGTARFPAAVANILDLDATNTAAGVPADQCMYQGPDVTTCAVTYSRYPNATGGAVFYIGWDFWNGVPLGPQDSAGIEPLLFTQLITGDCDANNVVDSLQPDCNANQVADACEILLDASLDCNHNGVLDSCEIATDPSLDCDTNGKIDSCELAENPALDCNVDGRKDVCEIPVPSCEGSSTTHPSSSSSYYYYSSSSPYGSGSGTYEPTDTATGDGDGDGRQSSAGRLSSWVFF